MPISELSDAESSEPFSSEEESDDEAANTNKGEGNLIQYERERLKRIGENIRRMEALGLHKLASSFMGSVQKAHEKKSDKRGKKKLVDEDEEYNPTEEDRSSSGEEDEEFSGSGKKKVKRSTSTPRKQNSAKMLNFASDFVDDDAALVQAIALSLQDSAGFLDVKSNHLPQSSGVSLQNNSTSVTAGEIIIESSSDKINENLYAQDDSGKRKRKKPITSRVQMSEDEMLIHFFQIDETGNGGIFLRDIRRVAAAHDFIWSEKEMADMIHCFDSDGDGKISLDDFRKIVCRCNMLKGTDIGMPG